MSIKLQLKTLIYRKHLDILALISLIAFCAMLVKIAFFNNSYIIITTTKKLPLILESSSLENRQLTTTENPFKAKMKIILNCRDVPLRSETLQYGEYWLLKNYIRGEKSSNIGCGETITYAANGDYTFMEHLPTVVERWLAPVSFALYAPGNDYNGTMDSIQYVRNCLPQSKLIRDYVTFHIFFPQKHLPNFIARNETEALDWSYDCNSQPSYLKINHSEMFRSVKNLTYPINVARNIARKTANTYFIFVCDIELYPSLGLVQQFLDMVEKNPTDILNAEKPKVFALPVFEIQKAASLPRNKEELQQMLNTSMAITFHKYVCPNCHLVPQQQQWTEANNTRDLSVFTVGKRYGDFMQWEPFYISDNKEPLFDERVTWEGQSDKRIQNYAMCLLDYEYHILHPAFLVHAPGIKVVDLESEAFKKRQKYAAAMNTIIYNQIMPEYEVLFGKNILCGI